MIEKTLVLIEKKLSEFFKIIDPANKNKVILSNIIMQDGSVNPDCKDKVVMVLTNIQHETIISTFNRSIPAGKEKSAITGVQDSFSLISPPVYINLFLLFTAFFEGKSGAYNEALKFISHTISFFQQNNVFNKDNLPGLDPQIDKLAFEMSDLDDQSINYLFGALGMKYLPSVYYKVRMIPFQSGAVKAAIPVTR